MPEMNSSKTLRDRAQRAQNKPSPLGEDIDLSTFTSVDSEHPSYPDPSGLPAGIKERMLAAGVTLDDISHRSGTYIQMDNTAVPSSVKQDGIEVMALSQAMARYDWIEDYLWKAIAVDTDKYTANIELGEYDGYFIRALPGARALSPVQSCLYLAKAQLAQNVHNVIIAEEGSELHVITGCASGLTGEPGLHMGASEFYIKKGARVTFTMIHSWSPEVVVRPRTAAIVEAGGLFLSSYVLMKPVRSLQMNPLAWCVGEGAIVRFNNVMVAGAGSSLDVGSRVILGASGARTEIISRTISSGGDIYARGYIEGSAPGVKGHLECRGLILAAEGMIHAVPELKGTLAGIDLSHEAAVGRIAEEEVEYLMARGLSRSEAIATIVHGFLRVDVEGLPPMLESELQRAVERSEKEAM